ncbi:glutamine synthetase family protein [Pleurocapsa sp. FMAR1]|uniref:glutamine synthetase family protein n=1 Tax=Pleurocapsa sp. FMAR1 TaxID=3040204 RepID=UPI0029C712F2|nr:glutamine synthetase family protein [Pleurocapsa sp. FMAR1]
MATTYPIKSPFIKRHNLWTPQQIDKAQEVLAMIEEKGIRRIRVGWGDQHGIVRSKTIFVPEFVRTLKEGKDFQMVTALFDTTNHPIVSPFAVDSLGVPEMTGLPDGILIPDPNTFRILPWAKDTGWILSDAYLSNGQPVPFSTRRLLKDKVEAFRQDGYELVAGLEMEFYVTRLEDPMLEPEHCGYPPEPPKVKILSHGYQYLTDNHSDEVDDVLRLLEDSILELGLPLATVEDEWGPGQCEFTFDPMSALEAADTVLLFRSAVKQICRRHGYHATFMAIPGIPNLFPSGWHLHQSVTSTSSQTNVFTAEDDSSILSPVGMNYMGGLLKHAAGASLLTTPTVNGYKRYRPDSFAPNNICWGIENRGSMLRVIAAPKEPSSRIENRVREPTANPYLYLVSQIISGREGIRNQLDPASPVQAAYTSDKEKLPSNLMAAIAAFKADDLFREELGDIFVDYFIKLKEHELGRFLSTVTDWEQKEYFEMY